MDATVRFSRCRHRAGRGLDPRLYPPRGTRQPIVVSGTYGLLATGLALVAVLIYIWFRSSGSSASV